MKKLLFIIILFLSINAFAELPPPPVIKDLAMNDYLKSIYDNHNKVEVVTTSPQGNRRGNYGDVLLYKSATQSILQINVSSPSGTIWWGTSLDTI